MPRKRLGWIAALTLMLQVGVMGAASAALCCPPSHHAVADEEMPCCKEANGAPHVCPLDKKPGHDGPTMEACCTGDQQALAALLGSVGIPEFSTTAILRPHSTTALIPAAERLLALVVPPDAPPPRL